MYYISKIKSYCKQHIRGDIFVGQRVSVYVISFDIKGKLVNVKVTYTHGRAWGSEWIPIAGQVVESLDYHS